jgi:hypothetical protein
VEHPPAFNRSCFTQHSFLNALPILHYESLARLNFVARIPLWPVSSRVGQLGLETVINLTAEPGGLSRAVLVILKNPDWRDGVDPGSS